MADHFYVDPAALRSLAGEFRAAAERLGALGSGFSGDALAVGEAFGLLGACSGAAAQYRTVAGQAAHGLDHLAPALAANAAGLSASLDRYCAADRHNSRLLGGH